ncbi:SGNH/GDSL hydrolase family protein [Dyella terrae]|uniref:SGNH/GDSL hydrolase family protein n=1 Tax=Dyella terrae TaxID=522259 RepID=UPI001EFC77D6|nr:SGNH/GDSL hydrolase family protein [Dyella terrae]ULU24571.1 lipase [Dyella terrae]
MDIDGAPLLTTPITEAILKGAVELEITPHGWLPHRLPAWARRQSGDPQLLMAESQPSGIRLVFQSEATVIELDVVPTRRIYVGFPERPPGIYDLMMDGQPFEQASSNGGNTISIDVGSGAVTKIDGPIATVRFDGLTAQRKTLEIWLPFNETCELVGLRTNAPIEPMTERKPIWLHHGSSISQGSNADRPSAIWPALVARHGGLDLVNLGFGGSALLDPFTARTMRDIPADFISVKLGINLVNTDVMRLRAFGPAVHGFLDTIRDGHPDTPLLVVSPLYCPIHEDTPGPGAFDFDALSKGNIAFRATGKEEEKAQGKLTLTVIRNELSRIVRERSLTDPNIHYLDGLALYGPADFEELPLPDRLHPDAATHRRIAERFTRSAWGDGGAFASTKNTRVST